ncbi:MAG: LysM peptidoglycan-binding domain-containing protein [Desulfobacterales bacterium]
MLNIRNLTILTALLCLLPCATLAADDHSIEFVVKDGDNLYKICEQILENPEDWRWVAMVNRIKSPNIIFPGQKLIIPVRLLKGIPIDGLVTFIKGVASVKVTGTEKWKPLSLNERISQGNWIRTGGEGTIEISFENGFSVLLRPDTTVEITAARKKSAVYLMYQLFVDMGKTISKIKASTGRNPFRNKDAIGRGSRQGH